MDTATLLAERPCSEIADALRRILHEYTMANPAKKSYNIIIFCTLTDVIICFLNLTDVLLFIL